MSLVVAERDPLSRRIAAAVGFGQWDRDDHGRLRRGMWMQCYSGQKFFVLDPRPEEVHYDDVCVGIARACRYGNQCREFYPVAVHSVHVSLGAEKLAIERGWSPAAVLRAARYGLLHDATEAYLGDIPRPLKRQREMAGYCRAEKRLSPVIAVRFGLMPTKAEFYDHMRATILVKEVDNRILLDEIEALMIDPDMWVRAGRYADVEPMGVEIAAMEWQQAADVFSQRFNELFPDFH